MKHASSPISDGRLTTSRMRRCFGCGKTMERNSSSSLHSYGSTLNSDTHYSSTRDILTVFQASPIPRFDFDDKSPPTGILDIELEGDTQSEALEEAQRVAAPNVRDLEQALREARGRGEFGLARSIKGELERLTLQEKNSFSSDQRNMQIGQLRSLMEDAVAHHNLDVAESMCKKIVDAEDKLNHAKQAQNNSVARIPKDPPAAKFEYAYNVNDHDDESISVERDWCQDSAYYSNRATSMAAAELASPGAFHIQGNVVKRRGRSDFAAAIPTGDGALFEKQCYRDRDTIMETAERNLETKDDQFGSARTGDTLHVGVGQWAVPRSSLETTTFYEYDSDDETFATSRSERKPSASILRKVSSAIERDTSFPSEIEESTIVNSALSRGARATNPIETFWENPWCPLCNRVQIHDTTKPLTKTDTNGNYTVYKGFCLSRGCHTLEEAKAKLGEDKSHVAALDPRKSSTWTDRSVQGGGLLQLPVAAVVTQIERPDRMRWKSTGEEEHSLPQLQIVPDATVVPHGEAVREKSSEKSEEMEREQIQKIVRETINSMTVTATKVETIETESDSFEFGISYHGDYGREKLENVAAGESNCRQDDDSFGCYEMIQKEEVV